MIYKRCIICINVNKWDIKPEINKVVVMLLLVGYGDGDNNSVRICYKSLTATAMQDLGKYSAPSFTMGVAECYYRCSLRSPQSHTGWEESSMINVSLSNILFPSTSSMESRGPSRTDLALLTSLMSICLSLACTSTADHCVEDCRCRHSKKMFLTVFKNHL